MEEREDQPGLRIRNHYFRSFGEQVDPHLPQQRGVAVRDRQISIHNVDLPSVAFGAQFTQHAADQVFHIYGLLG